MADRSEFLIYARRIHNALRHAIEDGDGRKDDVWLTVERPLFEHYSCAMYLSGCLSFLEGRYGESPWNVDIDEHGNFDEFISNLSPKLNRNLGHISKAGLDALLCIRNAITHNGNDLSKNRDTSCLEKVKDAELDGIKIDETTVVLKSDNNIDFMSYVRRAVVALAMYFGDESFAKKDA